MILLMEKILQPAKFLKLGYKKHFGHPKWCRIFSINLIITRFNTQNFNPKMVLRQSELRKASSPIDIHSTSSGFPSFVFMGSCQLVIIDVKGPTSVAHPASHSADPSPPRKELHQVKVSVTRFIPGWYR